MKVGLRQEPESDPQAPVETVRQRRERLNAEAAMLQVARADIAAGRCLSGEEAEAWLDAWARGDALLPAQAGRTPKS